MAWRREGDGTGLAGGKADRQVFDLEKYIIRERERDAGRQVSVVGVMYVHTSTYLGSVHV